MSSTNAIIINATNTVFEDEVTSAYTPHKMSAWDSFKGFWMTHHNLRRHPFAAPGTPVKTANKSAWSSLKEFFQQRQKFGRHPFATQV